MRRSGRLKIAALLTVGLASCTTSDALTPQVDVGGGMTRSSTPVTQDDTDRMAGDYAPQRSPPPSGGYTTRPQNTLEAQARALQDGNSVSPSSSGPPPDWQGNESGPGPLDVNEAGLSAAPQIAPQSPAGPQPAAGGADTIRFLPIIGAPVQAVTPLSRQLGAEARANGLTIRPSNDSSTQRILKGYFSAFADGSKVTIVYVWDVLDNAGERLHRMQGQETLPAQGSDPWTAVPPSLMQQIATKTIRDYLAWRQTQAG